MPGDAQEAILLLIRAWPYFEIALTDWLIAVSGMDSDIGALFVGRMDTRGKIDKLKEIYSHRRDADHMLSLKNLGKSAEGYILVRNTVVHSVYLGHLPCKLDKPDAYQLVFSNHRPVKGKQKYVKSVILTQADIAKTASFAGKAADKICGLSP